MDPQKQFGWTAETCHCLTRGPANSSSVTIQTGVNLIVLLPPWTPWFHGWPHTKGADRRGSSKKPSYTTCMTEYEICLTKFRDLSLSRFSNRSSDLSHVKISPHDENFDNGSRTQ